MSQRNVIKVLINGYIRIFWQSADKQQILHRIEMDKWFYDLEDFQKCLSAEAKGEAENKR